MIDFQLENINKYFTWKEALWLPSWEILHTPSDKEIDDITKMADTALLIREYIGFPMLVNCWLRPNSVNCPDSKWHGCNYNAYVGGAPMSMHVFGRAIDFHCREQEADIVRENLRHRLDDFNIRMEWLPASGWIHVDNRELNEGGHRYFIP